MLNGDLREYVRRALGALPYDRMLQVTSGALISATRFKISEGRNVGHASCPGFGARDSWEHCKECDHLKIPTQTIAKLQMEEMGESANKLCASNPARNAKYIEAGKALRSRRGRGDTHGGKKYTLLQQLRSTCNLAGS